MIPVAAVNKKVEDLETQVGLSLNAKADTAWVTSQMAEIVSDGVNDGGITPIKLSYFDKVVEPIAFVDYTVNINYYTDSAGNLVSNTNYNSTSLIPVVQGDIFKYLGGATGTSVYMIAYYDTSQVFISAANQGGTGKNPYTFIAEIPANVSYIRLCAAKTVPFTLYKYNIIDLQNVDNVISATKMHYAVYSAHDSSGKIRLKFIYDSGNTDEEQLTFSFTVGSGVSNIDFLDAIIQGATSATDGAPSSIYSGAVVDYSGVTTKTVTFTKTAGKQWIYAFAFINLVSGSTMTTFNIKDVQLGSLDLYSYALYGTPPAGATLSYERISPIIFKDTNNPLYGKKLCGLGDSLMSYVYTGAGNEWLSLVGKRNNMIIYNHAISGNPISSPSGSGHDSDCMAVRYTSMEADMDYIIVMGGANDLNVSSPIGTNSDSTIATYKGALNVLIQGLIDKYPTGKILFCTNYNRYDGDQAYVDAMIEICALYSIPCWDNFRKSNVHLRDLGWMATYGADPADLGNRHLNTLGDSRVSTMYEALLKAL